MFHLEVLAERLPLTSIFQNTTFIAYVQGLANVTKIAKFNLPSIFHGHVSLINNVHSSQMATIFTFCFVCLSCGSASQSTAMVMSGSCLHLMGRTQN